MKIDSEMLRKSIPGFLAEIRSETGNQHHQFRCHEYARLLARKLVEKVRLPVMVRDGIVLYNEKFLREQLFQEMEPDPNYPEAAELWNSMSRQTAGRFKQKVYQHSWCEVGSDMIVDFHANFSLSDGDVTVGVEDLLLVGTREELADRIKYVPCGQWMVFGKFKMILFPTLSIWRMLMPWKCCIRLRV